MPLPHKKTLRIPSDRDTSEFPRRCGRISRRRTSCLTPLLWHMSISAATVVTWRLCAEGPVAEVKYAFLWKNAVQIWEPSRNDKEVEFTHTPLFYPPTPPVQCCDRSSCSTPAATLHGGCGGRKGRSHGARKFTCVAVCACEYPRSPLNFKFLENFTKNKYSTLLFGQRAQRQRGPKPRCGFVSHNGHGATVRARVKNNPKGYFF